MSLTVSLLTLRFLHLQVSKRNRKHLSIWRLGSTQRVISLVMLQFPHPWTWGQNHFSYRAMKSLCTIAYIKGLAYCLAHRYMINFISSLLFLHPSCIAHACMLHGVNRGLFLRLKSIIKIILKLFKFCILASSHGCKSIKCFLYDEARFLKWY